jgi:hypothetical protein
VRTSVLFLLAGLVLPKQAAFRSEIALVRVDVEVMHNGQPVEELTKDDVRERSCAPVCSVRLSWAPKRAARRRQPDL